MAISYVGGKVAGTAGQGGGSITLTTGLTGGSGGAPLENDVVVVTVSVGTAARTPTIEIATPTGYTPLTVQRTTATTYDTNVQTCYKVMGATPDTAVTIPGSGNNADGIAYAIQVFRGVDAAVEDVTATYATGSGTNNNPNPASIEPVSAGAWIVCCGGGASATGTTLYTTATLSGFLSANGVDTNDGTVGVGYFEWTSGVYDPVAFGGGSTNAANSWGATTIALRPNVDPIVLTAGNVNQANSTTTGAASQTHVLAAGNVNQANTSTTGAASQTHVLSAGNVNQANTSTSGAIELNLSVTLSAGNVNQANTTTTGAVSQTHVLAAGNVNQANTTTTGTVSEIPVTELAAGPVAQANSTTTGAISQTHVLAAGNVNQANTSTTGAVSQTPITELAAGPVAQANTSTTGAISQTHVLAAASVNQANTTTTGAVTQTHQLLAAAVAVDHIASSSAIVQTHLLTGDYVEPGWVEAGYVLGASVRQANTSSAGAVTLFTPDAFSSDSRQRLGNTRVAARQVFGPANLPAPAPRLGTPSLDHTTRIGATTL